VFALLRLFLAAAVWPPILGSDAVASILYCFYFFVGHTTVDNNVEKVYKKWKDLLLFVVKRGTKEGGLGEGVDGRSSYDVACHFSRVSQSS
jgi:hypothetical protein